MFGHYFHFLFSASIRTNIPVKEWYHFTNTFHVDNRYCKSDRWWIMPPPCWTCHVEWPQSPALYVYKLNTRWYLVCKNTGMCLLKSEKLPCLGVKFLKTIPCPRAKHSWTIPCLGFIQSKLCPSMEIWKKSVGKCGNFAIQANLYVRGVQMAYDVECKWPTTMFWSQKWQIWRLLWSQGLQMMSCPRVGILEMMPCSAAHPRIEKYMSTLWGAKWTKRCDDIEMKD